MLFSKCSSPLDVDAQFTKFYGGYSKKNSSSLVFRIKLSPYASNSQNVTSGNRWKILICINGIKADVLTGLWKEMDVQDETEIRNAQKGLYIAPVKTVNPRMLLILLDCFICCSVSQFITWAKILRIQRQRKLFVSVS